MEPIQITHVLESPTPTEDVHSSYLNFDGSNSVCTSIDTNVSSSSYVLPPLPHQAYPPGQLVNPHTDARSCKSFAFERA